MAEENAPEPIEVVTPKPRAPRKPRKTAAQKAAELAEAEKSKLATSEESVSPAADKEPEVSNAPVEVVRETETSARSEAPEAVVVNEPVVEPLQDETPVEPVVAAVIPEENASSSEHVVAVTGTKGGAGKTTMPQPDNTSTHVAEEEDSLKPTAWKGGSAKSTAYPLAGEEIPPVHKEEERDDVAELEAMFRAVDPDPEPEPVIHPISVRGVVLAPGYWQGFEGPYGRINVFAWLGVVFAFVFFPLGFIFSLLGLANAKHVPNDKFGRALGWIGFTVSSIAAFLTLVWLILLPLGLMVGAPMHYPGAF